MNIKERYERAELELTFFGDKADILNDSDVRETKNNITRAVRSSKPFPYMNGGRNSLY